MLSDKRYADDIAIIVNIVVRMNSVLSKHAVNSKYFGLSINIPKTRDLLLGSHPRDSMMKINESPLKIVSTFISENVCPMTARTDLLLNIESVSDGMYARNLNHLQTCLNEA